MRTEHTSFLSFPAFESTQGSEKKNIIKQMVKSTVDEIWPDWLSENDLDEVKRNSFIEGPCLLKKSRQLSA